MASSRWNADLVLMAVALGAVSLAYAAGAIGFALHPPGRQAWSSAEIVAVGLYPLGWVGLAWAVAELRARWRRHPAGRV